MEMQLLRRMRRNRRLPAIRSLARETRLHTENLIQPLFVTGGSQSQEISSMPGIRRLMIGDLLRECREIAELGIPAVAVFPCIEAGLKDPCGTHGSERENILYQAVRAIKKELPGLVVITDVALDPYTSHGHDGILNADGDAVLNDKTVAALCRLAVMEAEAGADIVAPSDMMDGRIRAIRVALDEAGFQNTGILSYAAKYASAFYGPFRDAVGSRVEGRRLDKRTYQMDPANVREALLEVALDEDEGADMVMVKPAGPYLDVIRAVREATPLPLAAYQVSGEFAQIHAAAKAGWIEYAPARDESLVAIRRAGADMILTYFAKEVAADF